MRAEKLNATALRCGASLLEKIRASSDAGPARLRSQGCSVSRVAGPGTWGAIGGPRPNGSCRRSQIKWGTAQTVSLAPFGCRGALTRSCRSPCRGVLGEQGDGDVGTEARCFTASRCCGHECWRFKERAVGGSPASCHKVSFLCLPTADLNFPPAALFPAAGDW